MLANCRSSVRRLATRVDDARVVTWSERAKTALSQSCKRQGTGSSADLHRIGDVPRQMRQAGLVRGAMTLLGRVAVREPHRRTVPIHHCANHTGPAGGRGLMHDGVRAVE